MHNFSKNAYSWLVENTTDATLLFFAIRTSIKAILTIVFDLRTRSTRDLCKIFTTMSDVRELFWIWTFVQIVWKSKHFKIWMAIKLASQSNGMVPWCSIFTQ